MATNFVLKPFTFDLADLTFMRDQIDFVPLFDDAGNVIIAWNGVGPIFDAQHVRLWDGTAPITVHGVVIANPTSADALAAFGASYDTVTASQGLRDVTGLYNNLFFQTHTWGAVDQVFLSTVPTDFTGYLQPLTSNDPTAFYGAKAFAISQPAAPSYIDTQASPATNVVDYTPRMISRLVTTAGATPLLDANGQVVHWSAGRYANDPLYRALFDTRDTADALVAADLTALTAARGVEMQALVDKTAATTAANDAAAMEAAKLSARDAAANDLAAKDATVVSAHMAADTALADDTAAQATVVTLRGDLYAALTALLSDPASPDLNAAYMTALNALLDGNAAATSAHQAYSALHAAEVAARTVADAAVGTLAIAQSALDDAVAASILADQSLAAATTAATVASTTAAAAQLTYDTDLGAANAIVTIPTAGLIEGAAVVTNAGLLAGGQHDAQDPTNGEMFYGSINPGVAPSNSWLAYFGQFFDHGLDFVSKGAAGVKITIPLALDDPLYRAPGTLSPHDPGNTKITVSRADVASYDASGNPQFVNHSSPYIDQSQTYGSHAQMTALLREWVAEPVTGAFHAGAHLLDGETSVAWKNAWGATTNATLPTLNEMRVHLVSTGRDDLNWSDVIELRSRDAQGHVIDGDAGTAGIQSVGTGQALLLDMSPHFDAKTSTGGHIDEAKVDAAVKAALHLDPLHAEVATLHYADGQLSSVTIDDGANPAETLTFYKLPGPNSMGIVDVTNFSIVTTNSIAMQAAANEILLESVGDHYLAGDGRVNENIGLTTIHHVFHEEHNFQVRNIQESILAQDARQVTLDATGLYDHSVAHDWQVDVGHGMDAAGNYVLANGDISWNEDKLFNAAKLTVEMEYQHAAVDQYARSVTPDLPEFVGYNSHENATVSLEYAQAAFRFGHSTMRETIDYMDPTGSITGKVMSIALEQAFLNPELFSKTGAAAIAMGMTHQQMNEVDEFLTPAMNQGLLGQPLDLAAINIARGRDIGLPTLNDFREAIGLTKYVSWANFEAKMGHPDNLASFVAAYSLDGDLAKAQAIIGAQAGDAIAAADLKSMLGLASNDAAVSYAIEFLNGGDTGFNRIDTWIGGLAEHHVLGGLLGATFNAVFVDQINRLMDGDRFYYLYRLNNLNMGDEIANAQFKDIVERNTGLEHLNGSVFAYADQYVDLSASVDPSRTSGSFQSDHKYGALLDATATDTDPTNDSIGIYSTGGVNTGTNGANVTVDGTHYLRDIRAETDLSLPANQHLNLDGGLNLDGTPNTGANSNEVLIGTDRNDYLDMQGGDDTAYGEGGNDIIFGGDGIDRLYGGDGNDTIYGGDGPDLIDGGAGDDLLYGDSSASAMAGVDQIIGGAGNDTIHGGIGIDKLSGGAGDDVMFGEQDTDAFTHGGDGNDYIDGGMDGDLLWGDGGDDLIVGGNNQDIVAGLDGDDILRPGNPSSAMGGGPDEVLGGDGKSDLGNDGRGVGFDLIDFSDYVASNVGVSADFATQNNPLVAIDGTTPFPAWVGIEGLIGSRNNETVIADAGNNWLFGGSGSDLLEGGGGNDLIVGDGIRLDSLIGTYGGGYDGEFDGATHRALGFIQDNGLLGRSNASSTGAAVSTTMFDKHFTEMLKSAMFKDLELGSSASKALQVDGIDVAGTSVGDGGVAGSDTAVFAGTHDEYRVEKIDFIDAAGTAIRAYKITDLAANRDGVDLVVGVESFKFADMTLNQAQLMNVVPVITSNGGSATATVTVAENTTAVAAVTATDANNVPGDALNPQPLTFSIAGGSDAALFTIDSQTGVLGFLAAPNFELPADQGGNGVYDLVIMVSDGLAVDTQALAVTVTNLAEAGSGAVSVGYTVNNANTTVTLAATNTLADPDLVASGNLSGAAAVAYQWQYTTDGGATWQDLLGQTGAQLTPAGALVNSIANPLHVVASYVDPFGTTSVASAIFEVGNVQGNTLAGTAAADTLIGLNGSDTYVVNNVGDVVVEVLNAGSDTVETSLATYTLGANVERLSYINTINPPDVAFTGVGNASANVISGGSAGDVLTGGAGNDTVNGNGGADRFIATIGDGNDIYNGGQGSDTYDLSATSAATSVNLSTGTASSAQTGTDTLSSIENVIGGSGVNMMTDGAGSNRLDGLGGDDIFVMTADNAADVIIGGTGRDTIDYSAFASALTVVLNGDASGIVGGSANNTANRDQIAGIENFIGGTGNDTITGDGLANAITGGRGADVLSGGGGIDTFIYTNVNQSDIGAAARDRIADFLSGVDSIDLSGIDANTGANGNQAFSAIAAGTVFSAAGQLRFHYEGTGANEMTIVEGNVNANLAADFQLAMNGHITFTNNAAHLDIIL